MPLPLLLGLGLAAGGATMKGINYLEARKDRRAAERALDEEQKNPYAQYAATGELSRYYSDAVNDTINPQGLTAGERATYQEGIDRTINTMASNARRGSGGSINRYIMGALNPAVISSNNQLVAQDAAIKRANRMSAYGRLGNAVNTLQGIKNLNTAGEIQRKLMREQYLGQSVLQNKAFQTNTLDSIGSDLLSGGLLLGMGNYSNSSGAKRNPYTTVSSTEPINAFNPYVV